MANFLREFFGGRNAPAQEAPAIAQPAKSQPAKAPPDPRIRARTLRICSIPSRVTENEFRAYLKELLGYDDFFLSFVPSKGHITATITLTSGEPSTLLACSSGKRIYLPYQGAVIGLVVDCDFLGMTPLYSAAEPAVDIVAVTGLAGHAYGSWKSRDQPWMWLRDFLPSELEGRGYQVRILTFGYDSALVNTTATPSIQHYARTLLDSLNSERNRDNERRRPIIFIGHSLGGLVIKQALADASQQKGQYDNDQAILDSCTGLFFFGVPNRGLDAKNLRTLVKDQKNEHFINDLREGSELLWQAYQRFLQGVELQGCQITSFYELKDTQTVIIGPDGSWKRSGEMIRVVTRDSATFSLPTEAIHRQVGINADHSDMVKFTDNCDNHYITVRERLSECVASAPDVIRARSKSAAIAPSLTELRSKSA